MTSFWRWNNLVDVWTTLLQRRNNVVCLLGNSVILKSITTFLIRIVGRPDPPVITYRFSHTKSLIVEWQSEREDIVKFEVEAKHGSLVVKRETVSEKIIEMKGLKDDVLYTFQVVAVDVSSQKSDPAILKMRGTFESFLYLCFFEITGFFQWNWKSVLSDVVCWKGTLNIFNNKYPFSSQNLHLKSVKTSPRQCQRSFKDRSTPWSVIFTVSHSPKSRGASTADLSTSPQGPQTMRCWNPTGSLESITLIIPRTTGNIDARLPINGGLVAVVNMRSKSSVSCLLVLISNPVHTT